MAEENQVEQTQAPTEAPAAETPAQEQNFDLTVQDLGALKNIIDVAAQRGSFKPNEMQAVGTVYNKLAGFLEAVSKQGSKPNV
jgi:hypothetical protein